MLCPANSWNCVNTRSRRAFFLMSLSVSNQPCLFGQLPSSQVGPRYPERHLLLHSYAKKCLFLSSLSLFLDRSQLPRVPVPPIWVALSTVRRAATAHDSERFAAEMQGSDYGTWANYLPRAQKAPQPQAEKTFVTTHRKKKILKSLTWFKEKLELKSGRGGRRYRKKNVRKKWSPAH